MDIIYEENHMLVVNKPGGLLTQPSGTDQLSLEQLCKSYLKDKYQKPGNVFLEAVHRLDKPVSGIVVFARTSKALSRLQASIREKKWQKKYLALVQHEPPQEEGVLEHYLLHDDYISQVVDKTTPNSKEARLHYRRVRKENAFILLEITLETGRYHQIRAQLAAMGCPILGDEKYGSLIPHADNTIALHHFHLTFPHPISQEMLSLQLKPSWLN